MAAPGGRGEVRVRLTFEYPPPALPQSRHLWLMVDTEQCRAVTDVSAIIRERFFYGRRGALCLYLDGCLLPPGESVRLIRDNDALSVKWEDDRLPKESRRVPEKSKRAEEEEVTERPRKKKRGTPEKEVRERPRKKNKVTPEEEVRERPRKKNEVTPEEEVREQPRKKNEVTPEEVREQPRKKNEVTPEEVRERPRKKNEVTPEEEVRERPRKKNEVTPEEVRERPRKKNGVTPEEEVRERPKKKARGVQQDSEQSVEASEKKLKNHDVSKKPPHQGELHSTVQKGAPLISTRRETSSSSSSSCSSEEAGSPLRTQQRDASSSLDGFVAKKPRMSGLTVSPPVYNGQVARGGGQHRPPLRTEGRGVGRGRGLENLPWRGRGFRCRGEAPPQNHFFYNYDPETIKEQQLNEDVSNVSVLIQNPPEDQNKDYSTLPLLAAPPQPGKIIAFKLLELTENYTPEVSNYKEGRILSYDSLSQQVEVEVLSQQKKKEPGKFDLVYEGEDGTDIVEYAVPQECKITQAWSSLIEPRLVTEHGPQQPPMAASAVDML